MTDLVNDVYRERKAIAKITLVHPETNGIS
jgi:hypothetical protein